MIALIWWLLQSQHRINQHWQRGIVGENQGVTTVAAGVAGEGLCLWCYAFLTVAEAPPLRLPGTKGAVLGSSVAINLCLRHWAGGHRHCLCPHCRCF